MIDTSTRPGPTGRDLKVSVVVISKDEPALADTLDSLARTTGTRPDEVVVVDASDGRLDAIRDSHPWVTWIPYVRRPGSGITIPEQRNLGVHEAIGEVIAFTDCGCVAAADWLDRLLAPILEAGEHVTCGRTGSARASMYDGIPAGASADSPPEYVDECPTINMAFRRTAFVEVGGFDESFDYGSDIDFSWRLSRAGIRIRYVPDAVVVHEWGDSARQRRRAVQYGRARARLYRKHPDRLPHMLRHDPIVAAYPVFLLGLPLTLKWRWYPALLAVPLWRNRGKHPVRVVVDHLWFATGVLRELGATATHRLGALHRSRGRAPVKVLALPGSSNPYQSDLYGAMAATRPITVRYLDGRTRSHTLNVLLLPFELVLARLRGFRVLHVHWVYSFHLAWARGPGARRAVELWYSGFLGMAAALGLKLVWTAHNVVPHEQLFRDDVAARRELVQRCDAVIAHSDATAAIVRDWRARSVVVVPAGVAVREGADTPDRAAACARLGLDPHVVRASFFGMVREYKGVDLLLEAVSSLPRDVALDVVIVGECSDAALRARLEAMVAATPVPDRLHARFEFVSEGELSDHLAAADFAVFPFREVTSSSSVGHALAAGVPVIIPSLAFLDDVPDEVAVRYDADGGVAAIVGALVTAASTTADVRAAMRAGAARFVIGRTWPDAAAATWRIIDDLLEATRPAPAEGRLEDAR